MRNRGSQTTVPVLTYHSIDASDSVISTAPAEFSRQMRAMAARGWRTLSLDELLAGHASGCWPARSLMITFDDGYRNVLDAAVPVLGELGFGATVFLVPDFVGKVPAWPDQPGEVRDLPLMNWSEIRTLVEAGFGVGAHSRTHARLPTLTPDAVEQDVTESKREIEDRCGSRVDAFAYPYGATTSSVEEIVGRHYRAAFGTTLAFVDSGSRPAAFERIDAYYLRGAGWIDRLDGLTAASYLAARRAGRAARAVLRRDP